MFPSLRKRGPAPIPVPGLAFHDQAGEVDTKAVTGAAASLPFPPRPLRCGVQTLLLGRGWNLGHSGTSP